MVNVNIFGKDWKENLRKKQKETGIIIDHETGKVISERKIKEETQEAVLKAMIEMVNKYKAN